MPDSKNDLLLFAQSRNELAFRRIVDRHGAFVFHSARRRVHDDGLAEEIAQNVFCRLAQKAATVSNYHSVTAWLHEATRREAAHCLRSRIRHQRRVDSFQSEPHATMISDEYTQELRELRPYLEEAIDTLKSSERTILFARLFEERGFKEISDDLGKSESACKMAMSRILEKLRKFLSARGITCSAVTLATLLQAEWARAAPLANFEAIATKSLLNPANDFLTPTLTLMTKTKTLLIAGLALLLIAGYQIYEKKPSGEDSEPIAHRASIVASSKSQWVIGDARQRSTRRLREEKPELTHEAKDLSEFYIPAMTFEETTLPDAMEAILARYREICRETGEAPLDLDWRLEGESQPIRNLVIQGDLLSICMKLGLSAKTGFQFAGDGFIFTEFTEGPTSVRRWVVPPTFALFLSGQFPYGSSSGEALGKPLNRTLPRAEDSPFSSEQEQPGEGVKFDLAATLRSAGFLEEGESVEFFSGASNVIMESGARSHKLFDLLVTASFRNLPRQVRFIVEKSRKGVVEILPNLIALPGQTGTIEIGKEYLELNDGEVVTAWVGDRVTFTTELYGLGERTQVSFSLIDEPSEEALAEYEKSGKIADLDLDEFKVEGRTAFSHDGQRLGSEPVEFFGTDREGNPVGLSFTSERIDATGRPVFQGKESETPGDVSENEVGDLPLAE